MVRRALLGPADPAWSPPRWLMPHQVHAAVRLAGRLAAFRGAVLADAPGLGKTYVGLAIATRYRRPVALVPASLTAQWRSLARSLDIEVVILSHEAVSRGARIPAGDLLVVDEAHRFRNPATRRYDRLARRAPASHLLLVTATPVVNRAADMAHLLRLFLPDHGLAPFGVRSIEGALATRAYGELSHAFATLIVARTANVSRELAAAIPAVRDGSVSAPPPLPADRLDAVIAGIEALEFPSFDTQDAAALMRLHLYARLASSVPALAVTLRRHRRYLDEAMEAAQRGQTLSRAAAWHVVDPEDEPQMLLTALLEAEPGTPLDATRLAIERTRLEALLKLLRPVAGDPKAEALRRLLAENGGKNIVFTGAIATAYHLARRLEWRRVAVVTGRGARIASGPVSAEEALALFAPEAQRARAPGAALQVDTLIATDLVSEGLNLQDADRVVHFDLPWSPLRLEQRVGRAARLGSRHGVVRVAWFRPPPALEHRLALGRRIEEKLGQQLSLGVPVSSRVGRAHVAGGLFDWREQLGLAGAGAAASSPCWAVVQAPDAAVFAVRWKLASHHVPTVIMTEGDPPHVVRDERRAATVIATLLAARSGEGLRPPAPLALLRRELRARLAALESGPVDGGTRSLARRILRRARAAAKARDRQAIALLDRVLDTLIAGVPAGATRTLSTCLDRRPAASALRDWLDHLPAAPRACPEIVLEAALFGDGKADRCIFALPANLGDCHDPP